MPYDFKIFKKQTDSVAEWLKKEFAGIRTGRASPAFLDSIMVENYGAKSPISQLGSVTTEDPKTIRISPYDMSQVKAIEKAITAANLGVSTGSDEKGVRVSFPELTADRRTSLIKVAKEKLEEARKTLRIERDRIWNDIQKQEKEGGMTEDDKFRYKKDMEKVIEETNKKLEEMLERKEKEITS